jgi:hypothetical protein
LSVASIAAPDQAVAFATRAQGSARLLDLYAVFMDIFAIKLTKNSATEYISRLIIALALQTYCGKKPAK